MNRSSTKPRRDHRPDRGLQAPATTPGRSVPPRRAAASGGRGGLRRRPAAVRLAAAVALLAPAVAAAQEAERPEIVALRIGFEDRYKVGFWTPVDVTIRGGGKPLTGVVTLTAPDSDGVGARVGGLASQSNACQVLPGAETTVRLYARFGQTDGEISVAVCEARRVGERLLAGRVLCKRKFRTGIEVHEDYVLAGMASTQPLFVTVGPASAGMEQASKAFGQVEGGPASWDREAVAVTILDVGKLPTRWYGYEGVDALAVATSVPDVYRKLLPDGARIRAMDQWVRMGGKLLLFVGSQADEILAPDAPLARFAPGPLEEVLTLKSVAQLEAFAGGSRPVPGMGGPQSGVRVARLGEVEGTVEVADGNVPMVVRRPYGLGQVVFVAVDLERPPFTRWPDRGLFLQKLLGVVPQEEKESSEGGAVMHYGYTDVSGQLRSALDRFQGVKMVSFWLVAGLILVYILLIGPGDYLFLRKVVGHMNWTWVTFPAIVLVVSVGAYALAYWLKGDKLRTNQVDVVDVDVANRQLRGTSWANLFSPRTETYNLSLQARLPDGRPAEDARALVSWMGLAGDGLGGMQPRAGGPQLWQRVYDFTPELDGLVGMPVQVWSSKSVTARWTATCDVWPEADLVREDQLPKGTITNTLPFSLRGCVLACGRWGYDLGTIRPGQTVVIDPMSRSRIELRTLLTGRTIGGEDAPQHSGRRRRGYDRDSVSLPEIVRTMMFFKALGGESYVGFLNRYQGFVDLSHLLESDRAILMAAGPRGTDRDKGAGALLLRDGEPMSRPEDQHLTMYRFVYPVPEKGRNE